MAAESDTLVNRFFDGTMNRLMVSFLDRRDFSEAELDELQEILDEKRRK